MSTPELNPISYVILGLVARDGPATPYALKQAVARGPAKLWRFPHTQLYTETARLADGGLLDENRERDGRRRRTYTITPEGRRALEAWLAEPIDDLPLLRDEGLMQLYFGAFAATEDVRRLAEAKLVFFREEHERLLQAEPRLIARGDRAHQLAVLRFGVAFTRMAVEFWEQVAREPDCGKHRARAPRRSSRG